MTVDRTLVRWIFAATLLAGTAALGFACSSTPGDVSGEQDLTQCNSPVPGVNFARVFPNVSFDTPTDLVRSKNTDEWFVTEKKGVIQRFKNDPNVQSSQVVLDITDLVNPNDREPGINGLALHPAWPKAGEAYVTYDTFISKNPDGTKNGFRWRLSRFTSNDGGKTLDRATEEVLFEKDKLASEHNGGQLLFHPTEKGRTGTPLLYVSVGDSEFANGPSGNAQNTQTIFGKFLRLDVLDTATRTNEKKKFDAPDDNPFGPKGEFPPVNGGARGLKEIYSWGHRNPWRFTFNARPDGVSEIWSGEVGQEQYEEVNIIKKGHNYGWNFKEALHEPDLCKNAGNCAKAPLGVCDPAQDSCSKNTLGSGAVFSDPVVEIPHRPSNDTPGATGQSVTGGFVYRGAAKGLNGLLGTYIFADFAAGGVYAVVANEKLPASNRDKRTKFTPLKIGNADMLTTMAVDDNNEIIAASFHGQLYRMVGGSCHSLPDPNARSYVFLSKQGILSFQEGLEYLQLANPEIEAIASFKFEAATLPKDQKDFAKFQGPDFALAQWKDRFMTGETVTAVYRNDLDLGFYRQMTCTKTLGRGVGGCSVTNWPAPGSATPGDATSYKDGDEPDPKTLTDDKENLGTVTMNLSADGFVRFYVFGAKAPHRIQPFAALDGEGGKVSPALCTPCHSGTYGGAADTGAIFREFEPASLRKLASVSTEVAEKQWFDLNQAISSANKALGGSAVAPLAFGRSAQQQSLAYLAKLYPTGAPPALNNRGADGRPRSNPILVPDSYKENPVGSSAAFQQTKIDLYTKLIGPYCVGCHRYNNTDLESYNYVMGLASPTGNNVLLHDLIFDVAGDKQRNTLPQMPQAAFQLFRLNQDADALGAINPWVAQQANSKSDMSLVTFSVITRINTPAFGPGDRDRDLHTAPGEKAVWNKGTAQQWIRIIGQTTPPPGTNKLPGSDPLSNWNPAAPSDLDLQHVEGDDEPGTGDWIWRGQASFPQNARIQFKAIVSKNETIFQWERQNQGDRNFVVPQATSANVDFVWENQ